MYLRRLIILFLLLLCYGSIKAQHKKKTASPIYAISNIDAAGQVEVLYTTSKIYSSLKHYPFYGGTEGSQLWAYGLSYSGKGTSWLRVKLDEPLKSDKIYLVHLLCYFDASQGIEYTACSEKRVHSKKQLSEVSVHIAAGKFARKDSILNPCKLSRYDVPYTSLKPCIRAPGKRDGWIELKGYYTAEGGEEYLTIGSFGKANAAVLNTKVIGDSLIKGLFTNLYLQETSDIPPTQASAIIAAKTQTKNTVTNAAHSIPATLENTPTTIYFGNALSLNAAESKKLDGIYRLWQQKGKQRLRIKGYAYEAGTGIKNIVLSADRAKKIANAFVKIGVPAKYVSYKGCGDHAPVLKTGTQGRVEIELY